MSPYERLRAWQLSHELALRVYHCTQSFPKHEQYGLTSQLRRSAASVPTNIAEGSVKRGAGEFQRYLDIARGSLAEVGYTLRLALDLAYLLSDVWKELDGLQRRAGFLIWRLYRSLQKEGARGD